MASKQQLQDNLIAIHGALLQEKKNIEGILYWYERIVKPHLDEKEDEGATTTRERKDEKAG